MCAALAVIALCVPATLAGAAPPEDTFELDAQVDLMSLTQGDVVPFTGVCFSELVGPGDSAFVRISRYVGSTGVTPFSFNTTVFVDRADATFSGTLTVPAHAPPGDYRFGGACLQDDQGLPLPDSPAMITGDPAAPPPPSETPPEEPGAPAPPAPPATPVPAEATLTG